jgi:hypothetical protein
MGTAKADVPSDEFLRAPEGAAGAGVPCVRNRNTVAESWLGEASGFVVWRPGMRLGTFIAEVL